MRDQEIRQRIDSFEKWHYRFDLRGNLTPLRARRVNRHAQRKGYFFDPLVGLFGGTLAGKRVLDLACNAGFWSLHSARAGCDYVLGIDGRQMHVDQANLVFEVEEVGRDRYDFVRGDIFETDLTRYGPFDVVLCLGLMYHVSKHVNLMEIISAVNTDVLVVDTTLSTLPGSVLELVRQDTEKYLSALDYNLAMRPTRGAVRDLAELFGYSVVTLEPDFRDENGSPKWFGAPDYKDGSRRAFVCAKRSDLSALPARVEPSGSSVATPDAPDADE